MTDAEVVPMIVTPETLLGLHAPTPGSARKTRQDRKLHQGECQKSGGQCQLDHVLLTYVDSRYVQQVLDSEVGPANWQDEYQLGEGGKVACRIGIYVEGRDWVWKGDGAGATDIEGDKGSFSDAFKRAAVKWGIARDLYDEKPTVPQNTPLRSPQTTPQPVQSADPVYTPASAVAVEGGLCPAHGWEWRIQPGGTSRNGKAYAAFYKCGGKNDGQFCSEKPSEEWVKAHPIP